MQYSVFSKNNTVYIGILGYTCLAVFITKFYESKYFNSLVLQNFYVDLSSSAVNYILQSNYLIKTQLPVYLIVLFNTLNSYSHIRQLRSTNIKEKQNRRTERRKDYSATVEGKGYFKL